MTQYTGIIFDKDGTLFSFGDTWGAWGMQFFTEISEGDSTRATELGALVGFDYETSEFSRDSVVIAGTPGDISEVLLPHIASLSHEALVDHMNVASAGTTVAEAAPLVPLLTGLRGRGLKLGVATNDAEMPARANLAAVGVEGLFDFIAGYDSGYGGKPAPGQLLGFCEALQQRPENVLMVGDSLHDLIAGGEAGMVRVGVLTGLASEADLAPHADVVLPDVGHLPDWLGF